MSHRLVVRTRSTLGVLVPRRQPVGIWSLLPRGVEHWRGVDCGQAQLVGSGIGKAVVRVDRGDDDLTGATDEFRLVDPKSRLAGLDNKHFWVRVAMHRWPGAGRR